MNERDFDHLVASVRQAGAIKRGEMKPGRSNSGSVVTRLSNHGAKELDSVRIGRRIHVVGNSCSGKSMLGQRLATALQVPFVELDAINWQPGWVGLNETDPQRFESLMGEATAGDGWVVAGSYMSFSQRAFWPRLETVVWLDLPMHLLVRRVLRRSWTRWRSKELLWGTNHERFWPQLMIWKKEDSLVWWIVTQHERKRRDMGRYMSEARWQHIQFLRLESSAAVEGFSRANGLAL